jgi:hypothetical protein
MNWKIQKIKNQIALVRHQGRQAKMILLFLQIQVPTYTFLPLLTLKTYSISKYKIRSTNRLSMHYLITCTCRLEFANEQIRILEKKQSELHEEKDSIYKYFCEIILKSKEIFLKSFSNQKGSLLLASHMDGKINSNSTF